MQAKLRAIKEELRRRMHQPIPRQGQWLRQVVTGYDAYHALPTNSRALAAFRYHIVDLWRRTLRRRSQKDGSTWERIASIANDWLPRPRILHPWPQQRFAVRTPKVGAGCPNGARPDLCGERSAMSVPTAILFIRQNALNRPDGEIVLRSLTCPVLVICGEQDAITPLSDHQEMAGMLPHARLVVVKESGHMTPMERPRAVTEALRQWLVASA